MCSTIKSGNTSISWLFGAKLRHGTRKNIILIRCVLRKFKKKKKIRKNTNARLEKFFFVFFSSLILKYELMPQNSETKKKFTKISKNKSKNYP